MNDGDYQRANHCTRCVALSADKAAFSAEQKVYVIHVAANLDAKMHVRKYFVPLYALCIRTNAFMRLSRIAIPKDDELLLVRKTLKTDKNWPIAA